MEPWVEVKNLLKVFFGDDSASLVPGSLDDSFVLWTALGSKSVSHCVYRCVRNDSSRSFRRRPRHCADRFSHILGITFKLIDAYSTVFVHHAERGNASLVLQNVLRPLPSSEQLGGIGWVKLCGDLMVPSGAPVSRLTSSHVIVVWRTKYPSSSNRTHQLVQPCGPTRTVSVEEPVQKMSWDGISLRLPAVVRAECEDHFFW